MADRKPDKVTTEQKKQQQAADGRQAMIDYEAQAAATRAKTEKLRALRLARDAAAPPPAPKRAAKSSRAAGSRAGSKASRAKAQPLSDWLDNQRKDGRRD